MCINFLDILTPEQRATLTGDEIEMLQRQALEEGWRYAVGLKRRVDPA